MNGVIIKGKEGGMLSKITKVGAKLLPYVLYVMEAPVRRELNREVKTILDVGCGQGLAARSC